MRQPRQMRRRRARSRASAPRSGRQSWSRTRQGLEPPGQRWTSGTRYPKVKCTSRRMRGSPPQTTARHGAHLSQRRKWVGGASAGPAPRPRARRVVSWRAQRAARADAAWSLGGPEAWRRAERATGRAQRRLKMGLGRVLRRILGRRLQERPMETPAHPRRARGTGMGPSSGGGGWTVEEGGVLDGAGCSVGCYGAVSAAAGTMLGARQSGAGWAARWGLAGYGCPLTTRGPHARRPAQRQTRRLVGALWRLSEPDAPCHRRRCRCRFPAAARVCGSTWRLGGGSARPANHGSLLARRVRRACRRRLGGRRPLGQSGRRRLGGGGEAEGRAPRALRARPVDECDAKAVCGLRGQEGHLTFRRRALVDARPVGVG
eukprot:scaffold6174_cov125-Isochrysis_galbana.AAC.21